LDAPGKTDISEHVGVKHNHLYIPWREGGREKGGQGLRCYRGEKEEDENGGAGREMRISFAGFLVLTVVPFNARMIYGGGYPKRQN
jgi:hypothetical protein